MGFDDGDAGVKRLVGGNLKWRFEVREMNNSDLLFWAGKSNQRFYGICFDEIMHHIKCNGHPVMAAIIRGK